METEERLKAALADRYQIEREACNIGFVANQTGDIGHLVWEGGR